MYALGAQEPDGEDWEQMMDLVLIYRSFIKCLINNYKDLKQ